MNWINSFELMCYVIVVILLVDLVRKRDYHALFTFGSAALVGFFMELAAVAVTDIYYYSEDFWISLGRAPYQFPFFGGLMWGGLTVCAIKLAGKLGYGKGITALAAGLLIVTMDLFLDVVAIRLDGGFWTWVGNPINLEISQHTFFSVIWVNFWGYMIETPTVVYLTLKKNERVRERDFKKQVPAMFLIALAAIVVTAVGSLLALLLNLLTDDWFACIAFSVLWLTLIGVVAVHMGKSRPGFVKFGAWDPTILVFWTAMYAYCLAAMVHLELHKLCPVFFLFGIVFMLATMLLCVLKEVPAKKDE